MHYSECYQHQYTHTAREQSAIDSCFAYTADYPAPQVFVLNILYISILFTIYTATLQYLNANLRKKACKVTTKNVNTQVKREIICKKDRFDIYRSLSFSTHSSLLSCEMLNDRMIKC